jgi:uncharacterized protein (DUF1499 family)
MAESARARLVAGLALAISVIAIGLLLLGGPGTRMGWWPFRTGFAMMQWAAYGGLAGLVLGIVALVMPGARAMAAAALVLGLVAFGLPWNFRRQARAVPPIHDISTDTDDPPLFVALAERPGATNPTTYGGPDVARQQKEAYPDVRPIVLPDPPARAFARVLEAVRAMGWQVAATDEQGGRVEATDTTKWFGFKDDVVIRVRPEGAGSRVDVRSKSRVGRSDVGANARRIRRFMTALGQ